MQESACIAVGAHPLLLIHPCGHGAGFYPYLGDSWRRTRLSRQCVHQGLVTVVMKTELNWCN